MGVIRAGKTTLCAPAQPFGFQPARRGLQNRKPCRYGPGHGNAFSGSDGSTETCSGPFSFYGIARKKGLKPILGCEIYVAKESRHKKTGGGDQVQSPRLACRKSGRLSQPQPPCVLRISPRLLITSPASIRNCCRSTAAA